MTAPPLAILQARMGSTRLPGKVLLKIGPETMVERIHRIACEAFGWDHVVVSVPTSEENRPLRDHLRQIRARTEVWSDNESDLLGRFWLAAHRYRWQPESIIVRITCDDPFKTVEGLRRVANGERLPVEIGGEAFTLAMLDAAHQGESDPNMREHITHALFDVSPPLASFHEVWTVDTHEDYARARDRYEREKSSVRINEWHEIKEPTGGWCAGQAGRPMSPDVLAALRAIQGYK